MKAQNLTLLALGGLLLTLGTAQAATVSYHQLDERAKLAWVGVLGQEATPANLPDGRPSALLGLRNRYTLFEREGVAAPWAYRYFLGIDCSNPGNCGRAQQQAVSEGRGDLVERAIQATRQAGAEITDYGRQLLFRTWDEFQTAQDRAQGITESERDTPRNDWSLRTWAQYFESEESASMRQMMAGLIHPQYQGRFTPGEASPNGLTAEEVVGDLAQTDLFLPGRTGFGGDYALRPGGAEIATGLFGTSMIEAPADPGVSPGAGDGSPAVVNSTLPPLAPGTLPQIETLPAADLSGIAASAAIVPPSSLVDNDAGADSGWIPVVIESGTTLGHIANAHRKKLVAENPGVSIPSLWGGFVDEVYEANLALTDDPHTINPGDTVMLPTIHWFTAFSD